MPFLRDLRIAVRSLARTRMVWITVALTLALGIGANAAIFSVVRGVLLRPLANRDEDRLLYVRQSAPGIGVELVPDVERKFPYRPRPISMRPHADGSMVDQ